MRADRLCFASPYIVLRLSWRSLYWITSGLGIAVWLVLIISVPETRWIRSDDELGTLFYFDTLSVQLESLYQTCIYKLTETVNL